MSAYGRGRARGDARSAGLLLRDTFTRADSASSLGNAETGQVWTAIAGTWGVTSGLAYQAVADGGSRGLVVAQTTKGDAIIRGVVTASFAGLAFRANGSNRLCLIFATDGALYKMDGGGTVTQLATGSAPSLTAEMAVRYVGTSIKCYVNDAETIAHTLAGGDVAAYPSTLTYVGLYGAGNTAGRIDSLDVRV